MGITGIEASDNGLVDIQSPLWYRDRVFYQIWPRSFKDGNADGIGDLWGVLQSLDYLKDLGVGGLWLSPFNASPNADFGYDVSDYLSVNPEYGDMDVLQQVFDGCRQRDIRILIDLVINHTSTEHQWFKQSRLNPDGPYGDYYIWQPASGIDPLSGKLLPPNNWESIFGGSAWAYDDRRGEFYFHAFSREQADLNMANPAVRNEIKRIMQFWLARGASGFRLDAINCIAKAPGFPDDPDENAPIRGITLYKDVPAMYDYLRELRRDGLAGYPEAILVGEVAEATTTTALNYACGENRIFDMLFTFEHMGADCGRDDFDPKPFDLCKLKRSMGRWQTELAGHAWNALYLENHDHPRSVNRFGNTTTPEFWRLCSKSLACAMLFLQGTPFIYQGEEIGMTNLELSSIEDYQDVQTLGRYAQLCEEMDPQSALRIVQRGSRESARTPMQWSADTNGGFSSHKDGSLAPEVTPWNVINPNYASINVHDELLVPESPLTFYRKAIHIRQSMDVVRDGTYQELARDSSRIWAYERTRDTNTFIGIDQPCGLLIVCSLSPESECFEVPPYWRPVLTSQEPILSNYVDAPIEHDGASLIVRPYECRVYSF